MPQKIGHPVAGKATGIGTSIYLILLSDFVPRQKFLRSTFLMNSIWVDLRDVARHILIRDVMPTVNTFHEFYTAPGMTGGKGETPPLSELNQHI